MNYSNRHGHFVNLSTSLNMQRMYDASQKVYNSALNEFPHSNTLNYNVILNYEDAGNYEMMTKTLKEKLKSNYTYPRYTLKAGLMAKR